jgi:starch synthase (maltosyl-transferring)
VTRILLLVTDLQPGGAPKRVVRWADWLRRIDITPIVGCLARRGPLNDELDQLGVENFSADASGGRDLRVLARLAEHIRRVDPDLIHSCLFHANLAARLVGRRDRDRPIVTSTATVEIERRWHRRLERWTRRRSTRHTCNSRSVAEHVIRDLGFPRDRVDVIPNGLDFDRIDAAPPVDRGRWGIPSDAHVIVWAGRMDPIKGLDTWIDAFQRIARDVPACGVLIGDGPLRHQVESQLDRRGCRAPDGESVGVGRIRVAGWSHDVIGWLKTADLLMFPSRTEGSPNVVMEAMAAGCPVVASRVPGCTDLIRDNQTGMLCTADDVTQFHAAAAAILSQPDRTRTIVAAAGADVRESQSVTNVLSAIEACYRTCLSGNL